MRGIGLTPISNIEREVMGKLKEELEEAFGLPVKLNPTMPEPDFGYDPKRGQYLSPALLALLETAGLGDCERVLGVVNLDLIYAGA